VIKGHDPALGRVSLDAVHRLKDRRNHYRRQQTNDYDDGQQLDQRKTAQESPIAHLSRRSRCPYGSSLRYDPAKRDCRLVPA
jgi:hypothetical protein